MTTLTLHSIPVSFPHATPYAPQITYMSSVLETLTQHQTGLLESPTGSGKTLALLCSTLAYSEHMLRKRKKKITVIYASRTHSQLEQVLSEFHRTDYAKRMNAIVLASRESMCIHEYVRERRGTDQIAACRSLVSKRRCEFKTNVDKNPHAADIADLEDIGRFTALRTAGMCPYFYARSPVVLSQAHLVLLPYPYLVDATFRRSVPIDWSHTVVVFDEAHNMDSVCEESSGFELKSIHFTLVAHELDRLVRLRREQDVFDSNGKNDILFSIKELFEIKAKLVRWGEALAVYVHSQQPQPGKAARGDVLRHVFSQAGLDSGDLLALRRDITALVDVDASSLVSMQNLEHLSRCITRLLNLGLNIATFERRVATARPNTEAALWAEQFDSERAWACARDSFRCWVECNGGGWTLHFWCFNAGLALRDLRSIGVQSMIFASGTLAPLDSFAQTMGLDWVDTVRLENEHVVARERVFCASLSRSLSGLKIDCSYKNRGPAYSDLAPLLVEIARVVPDGLICFLPSYAALADCVQTLHRTGLYSRLLQVKPGVFVETAGCDLDALMSGYDSAIASGRGAMMLAVCRGRLSEGMDFTDARARGVVLVGVPFPNYTDARVVEKRAFLDAQAQHAQTGAQWYNQQAFRAINQAAGRVIRHKDDFGGIVLLDERFTGFGEHLSKWLRPMLVRYDSTADEAVGDLERFFERMGCSRVVAVEPCAPASRQEQPTLKQHQPGSVPFVMPRLGGKRLAVEAPAPRSLATVKALGSGQGLRGVAAVAPTASTTTTDRLVLHTQETQLDAAEFIMLIRRALSPLAYDEFITLLKRLKSPDNSSNLSALRARIEALFKGVEGGPSLIRRFFNSLPPSLKERMQ